MMITVHELSMSEQLKFTHQFCISYKGKRPLSFIELLFHVLRVIELLFHVLRVLFFLSPVVAVWSPGY